MELDLCVERLVGRELSSFNIWNDIYESHHEWRHMGDIYDAGRLWKRRWYCVYCRKIEER